VLQLQLLSQLQRPTFSVLKITYLLREQFQLLLQLLLQLQLQPSL
jgi:hypothetical protein